MVKIDPESQIYNVKWSYHTKFEQKYGSEKKLEVGVLFLEVSKIDEKYGMFCVEILEEKLVKNVFFRVFESKKPLEKFSAIVFLDTK